jgi:rhamnosyltransferase
MNIVDTSNQEHCSIVIPTKNGGELFSRVIQGLTRQTIWEKTELLVVDSGSTDGTLEVAREAGAKVVEIPSKEFNHGATRDFGISLTNNDLVVLLVQDAVPYDANLLEAILRPFSDPETAGVYARQIPQPDADLLTKRNLNNWLTGRTTPEIKQLKSLQWYEGLTAMEKYCFCNFDNVCSAIRKSVWNHHKFGCVNFGEDIDWSERVLKSGAKIVYEPAAAVIHSHDRSVAYEYKRTYVCHRKLYSQFGIQLVPTLKGIFRAWTYCTSRDYKLIQAGQVPLPTKISLLAKSSVLNMLSAYAQYQAVRDESNDRPRTIKGV